MFARLKQSLYRHRMKFVVGGAVIGGIAFLSRYAEKKLFEWHDRQTQQMLEKQKRRQHYDCTQRTANATVLSLAGSMKEAVDRELNTDALLQAIRDQPEHKRVIWENLKVVGFSRVVTVVYTAGLVAATLRVQLMLLGGCTYGDFANDHSRITVSQSLQQKYLSAIHFLLEEGVPKLSQHVSKSVKQIVAGLPLTNALTLAQLEGIFQDVRLSLAGEKTSLESVNQNFSLEPWSHYVLKSINHQEGDEEDQLLTNMLIETSDVIDSEDFKAVMDSLIQQGFNHILDRLAEFYPIIKPDNQCGDTPENWVDNVNRNSYASISLKESDEKLERIAGPQNKFLNNSTLPVAKLVPIFSGMVHATLSPAPGQLLQKILNDTKLDSFGANVYEAFTSSQSNSNL